MIVADTIDRKRKTSVFPFFLLNKTRNTTHILVYASVAMQRSSGAEEIYFVVFDLWLICLGLCEYYYYKSLDRVKNESLLYRVTFLVLGLLLARDSITLSKEILKATPHYFSNGYFAMG